MKQAPTTKAPRSAKAAGESPDAMFAVLQAAEVLHQRLDSAMGAVGLSMAKFGVLKTLADAGESMALTELAAQQRCVRSNITQLVDRLEAEGLVKRVDDPSDRRSIRAALTPLGRERHTAGARALGAVQRELASVGTASDRAAVARVLSALK